MKIGAKNKKLNSNVFYSLLSKSVGLCLSFITIPIALKYLGQESYGLWITIFGIVNWINFFDFGLGHGLRNKLSEALAIRDKDKIKLIIQTGYSSVIFIAFLAFLLSIPFIYNINWNGLMNTSVITNSTFVSLIFFTALYVFLSFVLNLIKPIFYAYEQPQFVGYLNVIQQLLFLLGILYLSNKYLSNLIFFSHAYGISMFISAFILSFIFFSNKKEFIPRKFTLKSIKSTGILNLGLSFFVIQISILVLQSSDNIIITSFLGPGEVVPYSIVLKLFSVSTMLYGAVFLNSLRSSITHANKIKDFKYLKIIKKKIVIGFFVGICLNIILYIFFDPILAIWLDDRNVFIPHGLKNLMLIYSIMLIWNGSFIVYLNALSEIRGQLIISVFQAIINIPLSIILIEYTNFGSKGVIFATIICLIPMSIYAPIKCLRIK
ncbi:oligosaccharide flippase family protein [uncultured Polaribacter sp.]|uniref:lipopolysaccharide biosynthesis protein n=1 Tax=uncultured Polaribacter sp. TaxID=174711 RepID=UPI00260E96A2|nr:oligosaccharide flippase family protein [uncultured Polaribacter sp.]